MFSIKFNSNDPFEFYLRKFKRLYERSGILSELKKHLFFEKPSSIKKKKKIAAIRRNKKKLKMMSFVNNRSNEN